MKTKNIIATLVILMMTTLTSFGQFFGGIGLPWYKYNDEDIFIGAIIKKQDFNSDQIKSISGIDMVNFTYGFDFGGLDYFVAKDKSGTYSEFINAYTDALSKITDSKTAINSLSLQNSECLKSYKGERSSSFFDQKIELERLFQFPNIINRKNTITYAKLKATSYDCGADLPFEAERYIKDITQVEKYGIENLVHITSIIWGMYVEIYAESPFIESTSRRTVNKAIFQSTPLSDKEKAQLANMNFRMESSHPLKITDINNPLSNQLYPKKLTPKIISITADSALNSAMFINEY